MPATMAIYVLAICITLCVCVCLPRVSRSSQRPENGVGSPGTGVEVVVSHHRVISLTRLALSELQGSACLLPQHWSYRLTLPSLAFMWILGSKLSLRAFVAVALPSKPSPSSWHFCSSCRILPAVSDLEQLETAPCFICPAMASLVFPDCS